MNVFSAGDGNSLLNDSVEKKTRKKPSYLYEEVPFVSIEAFNGLANLAYSSEFYGQTKDAIRRFEDLHNISLMAWTKPKYLPPKRRYEIRMTMKIIRMELSRLRQKLTVVPS